MATNGQELDLYQFRVRNALTQDAIAKPLGTTRSFISMVETGKSKLPKDKLEMLLTLAGTNGWDVESLLPDYARIVKVLQYISDNNLRNPLSSQTVDNLRLGEEHITQEIVDSITAAVPSISNEWLLTGEGGMFKNSEKDDLSELRLMFEALKAELEECHKLIDEQNNMIGKLLSINK